LYYCIISIWQSLKKVLLIIYKHVCITVERIPYGNKLFQLKT